MNVLVERHHADLHWSLHLLIEKRLGGRLYIPAGMDWYDQGYFRMYGDLKKKDPYRWIAKQYLVDTLYDGEFDETRRGCLDYPKARTLTLEEAKSTPLDIIICSVNENESYFAKLKEFHPNAKFIRQVGNELDMNVDEKLYPNLMASAKGPYSAFKGPHKILYRQEFDLDLFKYSPPRHFRNFYSFQNDIRQFEHTWDLWLKLRHNLPEFTFKSYGVANDEGKIYPKRNYIAKMLESSFIFQSKGPWEGYGHVIFNALCLGRPMVIYEKDYSDKIAGPLLEDEKTCLFIDDNLEAKIRKWSQPDKLMEISTKARDRFLEVVNFDKEAEELKVFLENLI